MQGNKTNKTMYKYSAVGNYLDGCVLLNNKTGKYVYPKLSTDTEFSTLPVLKKAVCNNLHKTSMKPLHELIAVSVKRAKQLTNDCWTVGLEGSND